MPLEEKKSIQALPEEGFAPIFSLLGAALSDSMQLPVLLGQRRTGAARAALGRLGSDMAVLGEALQTQTPCPSRSYVLPMFENVMDTLQQLRGNLYAALPEKAARLAEFQLTPFLHLLREGIYFWGCVYPDRERMRQYYANEFAARFQSPYVSRAGEPKYEASIIVAAYNHLEKTKLCLESILSRTDFAALGAELIVIDHGSDDGTLAYFQSLPADKVIHLRHNVRMYMHALLPLVCQGRYLIFVSNDIIVTEHWAENLLTCMRSDRRIALAVPMTPNISNRQTPDAPCGTPEVLIDWAARNNRSDPTLWEDRARLMPPVAAYNMQALAQLGLADLFLYSMEFWDDDFSLRARRAGYRQILCRDTACYHFGSVTGQQAKRSEGTLEYGRWLFFEKNGVDAWGNGFCYDPVAVNLLQENLPVQPNCSLLGVDCGFGDTPLQVRNGLRRARRMCRLYNVTEQMQYVPDLAMLSDAFLPAASEKLADVLTGGFGAAQFDAVYFGRDFSEYSDGLALLAAARARLSTDGCVVLYCENPWYAPRLYAMTQLALPQERMTLLAPNSLLQQAQSVFSRVQVFPVMGQPSEFALPMEKLAPQMCEQVTAQLSVCRCYFICRI